MAGETLDVTDSLIPDDLGQAIADKWRSWDSGREMVKQDSLEIRKYITATDTRTTTNNSLPWNNKTTIPKLTQIRDNLFANYILASFPKSKWFKWKGEDDNSVKKEKVTAIESYMRYVVGQERFKTTIARLLLDYIDDGNAFCSPDWVDESQTVDSEGKVGYVGPVAKRHAPNSIVFNPAADTFGKSPKIFRSLHSIGEIKEILERESVDTDTLAEAQDLFNYLRDHRSAVHEHGGNVKELDEAYSVDGFTSWQHYMSSDVVELLTFVGDIYDYDTDTFLRNHVIIVADRHKIIVKKPNPSIFGTPQYYQAAWRVRQDNLWGMSPLANLVGMQYRIDHLENLKADLYDLTAFPPLKIVGYVDDFEWGPWERIYVGDDGDVVPMPPDSSALQANFEIDQLAEKMEQMAGAPKEALGFRSPGEKTAFEVQRLENAASRIFQQKIQQFEERIMEPLLNGMLELARRHVGRQTVEVLNDDDKVVEFVTLTKQELTGTGTLKPFAAQHFAEKANLVQNLGAFWQSGAGQDPEVRQHMSSIKLAHLYDELLEIKQFNVVSEYIRIHEQAEAARIAQSAKKQVALEGDTNAGLQEDDFDPELEGTDGVIA